MRWLDPFVVRAWRKDCGVPFVEVRFPDLFSADCYADELVDADYYMDFDNAPIYVDIKREMVYGR